MEITYPDQELNILHNFILFLFKVNYLAPFKYLGRLFAGIHAIVSIMLNFNSKKERYHWSHTFDASGIEMFIFLLFHCVTVKIERKHV